MGEMIADFHAVLAGTAEDEKFYTDIAPGETIDCAEIYLLRSHSPISVILKESWNWDAEVFGDVFRLD